MYIRSRREGMAAGRSRDLMMAPSSASRKRRAVNHTLSRISTLHLLIVAPGEVVLESRAHSTDALSCVCCSPWQLCFWSRRLGQCERCVSQLPCCQEAGLLVPCLCLCLLDAFTCFSCIITITQPAHQARRQDEPSSCQGKRMCSSQVVCFSICCCMVQLLEQRKEKDGYESWQCQLLFSSHVILTTCLLYHRVPKLLMALSVALFPFLIYSSLPEGSPISQLV